MASKPTTSNSRQPDYQSLWKFKNNTLIQTECFDRPEMCFLLRICLSGIFHFHLEWEKQKQHFPIGQNQMWAWLCL